MLRLHQDSTLSWMPGDSSSVEAGARLKDCPEMIAAGQYANNVPDRPAEFPPGASVKQAIAVGTKRSKTVLWFLCPTEQDMV